MTKGDRWVLGLGIAGAYALGIGSTVLGFNSDQRLEDRVADVDLSASEAKADARAAQEVSLRECQAYVDALRYELYRHIEQQPNAAHGYDPSAYDRELDRSP